MKMYENLDINDLENEIWKNILDYEGDYQVSNLGRIKSFKRYKKGKILKQCKDHDEYFHINLYKNGKKKSKRIHILLFENFNNHKLKENECVHHIDFINILPRISNDILELKKLFSIPNILRK